MITVPITTAANNNLLPSSPTKPARGLLLPLTLFFHDALQPSPAEQSRRAENEPPDDDLVLGAVALETTRDNVLFLGVLAEGQVVLEAEGAVALFA
jgi:hypothetical protein